MSFPIAFIGEGRIDKELVGALLSRIAEERCGFTWPVDVHEEFPELRIRKTGHGGVHEKVSRLVKLLNAGTQTQYHLCVIVLDRRTRPAQRRVRQSISGKPVFILGIAIEEIEAWWLADRQNVLQWLCLEDDDIAELGYGDSAYNAERDNSPKATLDELTRLSQECDRHYASGNLDLAMDFTESWKEFANLAIIEHECARGFAPFSSALQEALARARDEQAQENGRLFP